MKKIAFLFLVNLFSICLFAQSNLSNTLYKATSKLQGTVSINSPMGAMDIPTSSEIFNHIQINEAKGNTVSGTTILKRITGATSIMGQETKFDTDDKETMSNPQIAEIMNSLKKEEPFNLVKGATTKPMLSASVNISGQDLASMLLLPVENEKVKAGTEWQEQYTDEKGSTAKNRYTIVKVSNDEVELLVQSDVNITGTVKQMNMEIKQNMKGNIKSTRIYNKMNGFLKSETKSIDLDGKSQMMGQEMPMTIKGTVQTVISKS